MFLDYDVFSEITSLPLFIKYKTCPKIHYFLFLNILNLLLSRHITINIYVFWEIFMS